MNLHRRKKTEPVHPEADKALEEADKHLGEVTARADEVKHIAKEIRKFQKRNHFAERIDAIMNNQEYHDK